MEFILNLLLLNGKVLTRAAVNTVHEALQKCMRLQRKIRIEYHQASSMVGQFGNMLQFINYHVGELENEAANYLITGEIKSKVYDHFTGIESVRYISTTQQTYKPISEPSMEIISSEQENPTSDASTKPQGITRKRKLVNNGNEDLRNKINEEKFLVENLSAILKSQEFLFKNICKLMVFFENSQLKVDPAKLEKIKRKLYLCRRVLSSPSLSSKGLDDKAIDDMMEGEITRCRLASAEISKIPYMTPNELSKDSKVVIVASNPYPMPIKASKLDAVPVNKKKEDPGMFRIQEKMRRNSEATNKVDITKAQTTIISKRETRKPTALYNQPTFSKTPYTAPKELSKDSKVVIVASNPYPMPMKASKPDPVPLKKKKEDPGMSEATNKAEIPKAQPTIISQMETQKPTFLYNRPQFSSPIKFPELLQQAKCETNSEDKFKIIARVMRDNRKRTRRGHHAPFRMAAENFYKIRKYAYNSELVPVYLDENFKPSGFKSNKLSNESQLESNNNLMQLLQKNEDHFHQFEGYLTQSLITQKFLSMKVDCLNMCKCNYHNKRHFNRVEARIVEQIKKEEIREHIAKINWKNLSHFNRVEARIAQNLAMDHLEDSKENLGKCILNNEEQFNLADKRISENVARCQEAEVLDRNREMFAIMDKKLQVDEKNYQLEQLLAINDKHFVKAEKEIGQKLLQLKNDSLNMLKLLPRSIEIEKKKNDDELLLNMSINEFDKFEEKVRTIVVDEVKNHLRCHPLLSRYEQESLMEKNREAFNNLEETLTKVPIFGVDKCTTSTSLESIKNSSKRSLSKPILNKLETTSQLQTTETIEEQICYESYFKRKEMEIATINKVSSGFVSMVVNKTFVKTQDRITLSSRGQVNRIWKDNDGCNEASQAIENKKVTIISDDPYKVLKTDGSGLNEIRHLSSNIRPTVVQGLEKSKTFLKEDPSFEEKKTTNAIFEVSSKESQRDVLLEELAKPLPVKKMRDIIKVTVPKKTGLIPRKDVAKPLYIYSLEKSKDETDKPCNEAGGDEVTKRGEEIKAIRTIPKIKEEEKHEDVEPVKKPQPQLRRTTKAEIRRKQISTIIPKTEHVKSPRQHVINIKKVDDSTIKLNIEQSAGPRHVTRGYGTSKNQEKIKRIDVVCTSVGIKKVSPVRKAESTILPEGLKSNEH